MLSADDETETRIDPMKRGKVRYNIVFFRPMLVRSNKFFVTCKIILNGNTLVEAMGTNIDSATLKYSINFILFTSKNL